MSVPIRPPIISQEGCSLRVDLRDKLNLEQFLKHRTAFCVGESAVHCELYEYAPDAPTIIFLPGIGTYCELYAELLCKLSQQGFNVVGVDPLGHGYSGGSRGHYTVDQMCDAVSDVLDVLQQRFKGPFGVYGYSIGALLAVAAAEKDERLSTVLCGTLLVPDLAPDVTYRMGWNWTWASSLMMPGYKVPLKSFVDFEQLLKGHPAGAAINNDPLIVFDYPLKTLSSLFNHRCNIVNRVHRFSAAILHGDKDEVLPVSYSQRLMNYCEQPMELLVMKRQGHMVPLLQPDLVVTMAAQWFEQEFSKEMAAAVL
ncbi:alpha/beta fold hydrolase [Neptuniibacter sp. QD48_55]|uniref:alpha/beta fold hydrolase n=1 Tax=Neptuniibacter sp. QD48_55 TaxID=3398212 RepID=UPI0039F4F88C